MHDVTDRKRQPMNDLQQLIADYLAENPGESYASIARRGGMKRATVWDVANKETRRITPHPATMAGLAKGMGMPESRVRRAAGAAAGFGGDVPAEMDTPEGRLVIDAFGTVDPERRAELARRARFLLEEFTREQSRDRGQDAEGGHPGE